MYTQRISQETAAPLLALCKLFMPQGVDTTLGLFDNNQLVATASLKGDMIQGVAVHPDFQGEDLTGKLFTALLEERQELYLFTKPQNARLFESLGFRPVAVAKPYATLLEHGQQGVRYRRYLQELRGDFCGLAGAVVMNCNPFTLGHRYLIETAAQAVERLYVLVVEEEASEFPFALRYAMVEAGTKDIKGVTLLPSGRYAVSSLTFPAYFTKEQELAAAGAAMDAELFATFLAPALGVTKRFLGSEPLSPVTAVYNAALQERLPRHGIEVEILPRKEQGGQPISASRVRALWQKGERELVRALVPESTMRLL